MRTELLVQARIATRAVNIKHVASLSGSEKDLNKPAYRRIKGQMASMRAAIDNCRFLYLMGRRSDGTVFFFADSLLPDSKDYAPPGLIYAEVSDSYIRVFENRQEAVVGPVTDRWGTLITALVPLKDPFNGNLIAVLGMDVDADYWNKEILSRCSPPFAISLLFIILTLLLFSREKVANALRQSENKLRATLDATPFPVAIVDLQDDKISYWSRSAFTLFGHTAPTTSQWYEIAYPDPDYRQEVIKRWKSGLSSSKKTGQPVNTGEYRVTCKNGATRVCELYATFLPENLIVTFHDVTERKQAQKELLELKKRDQSLLDHSPVCHKIVDLDFNLQYMSANGFKMLKLDHDSSVYGKPYPFYFFPEAFRSQMKESLRRVKDTGKTVVLEAKANDIEGNEVWLDSSIIPVFDENGKIDYLTVVSADITRRKRDEQEKTQLEAKLLQSRKMESIGNLAGGIAHDFNNILSSIIGFTELALDEAPAGTELEDSLREVYGAGKRARDLVKQILAFARKSEEEINPIQPDKLVKEMLKFIRSTIPTTIEIRSEIQSKSFIMGNATQLQQVLVNLCTNAAQAMEESGGVLDVGLKDVTIDEENPPAGIKPGDYIRIRVADTGTGIAPEILDSIFEPYFTTKGIGQGTGLGLAMAQGLVEGYGGKITVDSRVGQGTTFTIFLPVTGNRSKHDDLATEPLPTGNERILLVDDEEPIARMAGQILERLGYSVTARTSSMDALERFRSSPGDFDLVITDMTMPNLTGDKLAVELMKIRPDIPVILCTGYSQQISAETAADIGIKAFAYKPVVKADLAKTVRTVLDEA